MGKTEKDYASIVQWMSFFNQEIVVMIVEQWLPLVGIRPYDKEAIKLYARMAQAAVDVVEEHLGGKDYLVGDALSLADVFCAGIITLGFQFFYDKAWRERNPNVSRWYEVMIKLPIMSDVMGKIELLDKPKFTNEAPKTNGA